MIPFCSLWNTENSEWINADWTWNECKLIEEVCDYWNNTNVPWNLSTWQWSECSAAFVPPVTPETGSQLPIGYQGVDATTLVQPWMHEEVPWNPYISASLDKKKKLVELICKVKGKEYGEEKEIKNVKVTVHDINMVVEKVSGVKLKYSK